MIVVTVVVLELSTGAFLSPTFGQVNDPAQAVFMLVTITHEGGHYKSVESGTAFFISGDGTALTNSHLVYRAEHDPDLYQLLAIVDKEFYSAQIVCASKLRDDPTKEGYAGVHAGRDVAEIKLEPSAFPFQGWGLQLRSGESLAIATAHRGALPEFSFLTLADHPGIGNHIHIVGFGHISPIPYRWTATGQISGVDRASDGTEIFGVEFTNPAQPGNSGSPVFNDQNRVIGIWTWHSISQSDRGTAQSNSALQDPCRQ